MNKLKFVLLFLFNLVVDFTILSRYEIYGYIPSITIPLIIIVSMYYASESIYYYSIVQGLFQDVAFLGIFGVKGLTFYLVSYYTKKFDYKNNFSLLYANMILVFTILLKFIINQIIELVTGRTNLVSIITKASFGFLVELLISLLILTVIYFIAFQLRKIKNRQYI